MMLRPDFAGELATLVALHGLPQPVREHKFHPERKWRIDLAWPEEKLAIEIEGGIWSKGRHIRPKGYLGDMEKYNSLAMSGWALLRVTPQMVRSGEAISTLMEWFGGK